MDQQQDEPVQAWNLNDNPPVQPLVHKPDMQPIHDFTPPSVVTPHPEPAADRDFSPHPAHHSIYPEPAPVGHMPEPAPEPVVTPASSFAPYEPSYDEPAAMSPSNTGNSNSLMMPTDDRPIPVVKVLSVRGIEYAMMSILLWFSAASLIIILVSIIMGGASFAELAFPVSTLIIAVPGFAWLYLRLRKAELNDPSLRLEASKRRFSQITQILAFLACFFNLTALVYALVSLAGGEDSVSIGKLIGSTVVILLIAGGILTYYWKDEHKLVSR